MYSKAQPIYFGLATIVASAALFAFIPFANPKVAAVQTEMMERFSIGWQQTFGDRPWFEEVSFIFDVTNNFYAQAAEATIAFLDDPETSADIYYVWGQVYYTFANTINLENHNALAQEELPTSQTIPNFMEEEPLYNLVPYREVVKTIETPVVAGANTGVWSTITDAITGQAYCLAVFNGEVNQYLGTCETQGYH